MKLAEAFEEAALSVVELNDALNSTKVLTLNGRRMSDAQSRQARDYIHLIRARRLIKDQEHADGIS